MADVADNFDQLADMDFWYDSSILFAGFLAPTLIKNTVETRFGRDLPDEVYGASIVVGSEIALDGDYKRMAQLGGGLHVVDALATRFNIKSRVQDATQGV